ncbi:MAG: YkgJ family cysteine cluster protein [Oceanidesulfovibrio sp.]
MSAECVRCGECCRRSTPALHQEDLDLIGGSDGLDLVHLVTFRRGELVRDQVRGVLAPLDQEVVKLRSARDSWACMFLVDRDGRAGCARYEARPLECRLLLCKDPRALAEAYGVGRVTRNDIIGPRGRLAELVQAHEAQCGYEELAAFARRFHCDSSDTAAAKALLAAVHFDSRARELVCERLRDKRAEERAAVAACVLGRPLPETMTMFGLAVVEQATGGLGLVARGTSHHPAARP